MTKIVLFNGPPGSGKDAIATGLIVKYPDKVALEKFAYPIKAACRAFYSLSLEEWEAIDGDAELKNQPRPEFFGQSCRQVQINMSELFAKPTHDNRIFGELCARRIEQNDKDIIFVSDSGFIEEAEVQVEKFGANNISLFRLQREGKTFDGDSRGYIHIPSVYNDKTIVNNGTLDETVSLIEEQLKTQGVL